MKNQRLVAVVGMTGAGKSEVINILKEYGFDNVYFGSVTFDEMMRRNLQINEANEKLVREELRSGGDMAIYAKLAEPKIRKTMKTGINISLESLYSWSEYLYLKEKFSDKVLILSVVADYATRLHRVNIRHNRPLTKTELDSRDKSQIENLEQGGPIARADFYIYNNGTKNELRKSVEKFISKIKDL